MGQQQLLLLVLSTVIVAFAVLAGLKAFDRSQRQAAIDQIKQEALGIAIDVQTYPNRPAHLQSGDPTASSSENDLAVGFSTLPHYDTESDGVGGDDYVGEIARYSLNGGTSLPDAYDSGACPDNDPVNTVNAYSEQHDVSVCVSIAGTSADDLDVGVSK